MSSARQPLKRSLDPNSQDITNQGILLTLDSPSDFDCPLLEASIGNARSTSRRTLEMISSVSWSVDAYSRIWIMLRRGITQY